MGIIDISQIDKVEDEELRKILLEVYETTDDKEQTRLLDEKMREYEKRSEIIDPYKPFITTRAKIVIFLILLFWIGATYYISLGSIGSYFLTDEIIHLIVALIFIFSLPILTVGILLYGYIKHKNRAY